MISREEYNLYNNCSENKRAIAGGENLCYVCRKIIEKDQGRIWIGQAPDDLTEGKYSYLHSYLHFYLYFHRSCFGIIAGEEWIVASI